MSPDSDEHHRQRSEFIRTLVQGNFDNQAPTARHGRPTPRTIVQYWHNRDQLPRDVETCMSTWRRWESSGFSYRLYDWSAARAYIRRFAGYRYERAFMRCYHPAMQADYFWLCFIAKEGGLYVDADDICVGADIEFLFEDGRLRLQPLCYDIDSDKMVDTPTFLHDGAFSSSWIFYFNNNPLAGGSAHPIIVNALGRATEAIEASDNTALPEIQSTTGPGNLSKSVFELRQSFGTFEGELKVLREWSACGVTKWPLSYREDSRNWRLSNQKKFNYSETASEE